MFVDLCDFIFRLKTNSTSSPEDMETLHEQRATIIPSKHGVFSMEEVSHHADPDSCWIVIKDGVYDVTNFLSEVCD